MPITVTFPTNSPFTLQEFADIVDFIAVDASVNSVSATQFTGTGTYGLQPASFIASGTGFSLGQVNGENFIVSGTLDSITFTTGGNTLNFTNMNIPMDVFSGIVISDLQKFNPSAIETYLLSRDWNIRMSNQDDIAPEGVTVGDNVPFNMVNDDVLRGMGGNDNLFSGGGNDRVFGNSGRDTLDGGTGNDFLNGGGGRDLLRGGEDNDRLLGGGNHDRLFGEVGNDRLEGGTGNDTLSGGSGRDVLIGGTGSDLLIGGGGLDRFVFDDFSNSDRIRDFNANNNREKIDLRDVTAITDFADLKANHMTQTGADVLISAGAVTILVEDTLLGDMNKGDFLF